MAQKPRLKTFLTVFPISSTTWGLRGSSEELWRIKLSDARALRAFGALLPYLNGEHPVDEILAKLAGQGIDREVALGLLDHLEKKSLIEEADSSGLPAEEAHRFEHQLAFFSRFTADGGAKLQKRLYDSRVAVVGDGALHRNVVRDLAASGVGEVVTLGAAPPSAAASDGRSFRPDSNGCRFIPLSLDRGAIWPAEGDIPLPQLVIVPQEAHDPELLEAMDAFSKEHDISWLLIRALDPHEGWVGPLFVPGDTASYVSLEARLRGNLNFFEEYQAFDGHLRKMQEPSARSGGLEVFFHLLSAIAVAEAVKYLSGLSVPHLAGRFLTINLLTWETETHDVLRVPRLEAQSYSRPRVFPWKDVPYGDKPTRRA